MSLSEEERKAIVNLEMEKAESDYNCSYDATEEDILPLIPKVGTFIEISRH